MSHLMSKIVTIAACVFDVILKNGVANTSNLAGAILNTTMTLRRVGANIQLCSVVGKDKIGDMFVNFFNKNKCDTSHIVQSDKLQSITAMAFIDEQHNASYMFYGEFKPDLVTLPSGLGTNDVIQIGDFVSLFPNYNNIIQRLPKEPIVYYDPNTRSDMDDAAYSQFVANVARANILRFSCDDLEIVNKRTDILAQATKEPHILLILVTYNDKVTYYLKGKEKTLTFPAIKPVNTIGAGDNFNAGFLYGFQKYNLNRDNLEANIQNLEACITHGVTVAQHICMSDQSYVSEGYTL